MYIVHEQLLNTYINTIYIFLLFLQMHTIYSAKCIHELVDFGKKNQTDGTVKSLFVEKNGNRIIPHQFFKKSSLAIISIREKINVYPIKFGFNKFLFIVTFLQMLYQTFIYRIFKFIIQTLLHKLKCIK